MNITSLTFLLFILAVFAVYYMIPKSFQWIVLLAASIFFYIYGGIKSVLYILTTSVSIYVATRGIQINFERQEEYFKANKESLTKAERRQYQKKQQVVRKYIMLAALILNIGILCVLKYFHFALEQINGALLLLGHGQIVDTFTFLVPLGLSFYTFQATGYLLDVYWEKCVAEKNYFKVLLFISFFPQITQGPISNYQQLSTELFAEHRLEYQNYTRGFQRMIWGFVKKMLLANILANYVQDVFSNYSQYTGVTVFLGAVMYSIQIYADFSGYMDIMCGFCEVLGIHLTENFERPYFSKSIAEYWRRWHISLGTWFKNYIYYPIAISNWNRKLAKVVKVRYGKRLGDTIPASIALVVVWFATGLWHGASWAYIVWGGVNGLFIIFSLWMEPVYDKTKKTLRIDESKWLWRAFQTIRTFILVTFIKVLPEVGTLSQGVGLIKRIFTNSAFPRSLRALFPFINFSDIEDLMDFGIVILITMMLFCVSLRQRKRAVRDDFNKLPTLIRMCALSMAVIVIVTFGVKASYGMGGFMYADF